MAHISDGHRLYSSQVIEALRVAPERGAVHPQYRRAPSWAVEDIYPESVSALSFGRLNIWGSESPAGTNFLLAQWHEIGGSEQRATELPAGLSWDTWGQPNGSK